MKHQECDEQMAKLNFLLCLNLCYHYSLATHPIQIILNKNMKIQFVVSNDTSSGANKVFYEQYMPTFKSR